MFMLFSFKLTSVFSNFLISKFLSNNVKAFVSCWLLLVKAILLTKFSLLLFLFEISLVSLLNWSEVFLKFSALDFTLKDSIS